MDCGEEAGVDGANHESSLMTELVRLADFLAGFGKSDIIYEATLMVNFVNVPLQFFAQHRGHDLRAISEYGQLDVVCGDAFHCGSCGGPKICEERRHVDMSRHHHGHKQDATSWHFDKTPCPAPSIVVGGVATGPTQK